MSLECSGSTHNSRYACGHGASYAEFYRKNSPAYYLHCFSHRQPMYSDSRVYKLERAKVKRECTAKGGGGWPRDGLCHSRKRAHNLNLAQGVDALVLCAECGADCTEQDAEEILNAPAEREKAKQERARKEQERMAKAAEIEARREQERAKQPALVEI